MTIETPATESALAALIAAAGEGGGSLSTEGSGTKRHCGPAASPEARRLSLRGLSRVTAHEPADMILSALAGARLRDLQTALAAHDQWLPLDPPFADATIGGIIATNASGPRRLGYGTSKDLLLGLRVLGARGRATKSGGRVVKNVSGYDLHHLQVGAFGSLGVLVEVHLKVSARPEVSALWALPCPTLAAAHGLLLDIGATALRPVALEALDGAEAARVRARAPVLPGREDEQAVALVGLEGSRASFERHVRELAGKGAGALVVERPAVDALWAALAELPTSHASNVRVRVGARPHDLPALLAAFELDGAPVCGVAVRVGSGLAHVALDAATEEAVTSRLARWRLVAAAHHGYAVVESAPLDLPGRARLPFGGPPSTPLGPALRRAWDPSETLNPGRMAW
jgi:glycolate oxidase FAD binding subunit